MMDVWNPLPSRGESDDDNRTRRPGRAPDDVCVGTHGCLGTPWMSRNPPAPIRVLALGMRREIADVESRIDIRARTRGSRRQALGFYRGFAKTSSGRSSAVWSSVDSASAQNSANPLGFVSDMAFFAPSQRTASS
jgi:hypothetical protein